MCKLLCAVFGSQLKTFKGCSFTQFNVTTTDKIQTELQKCLEESTAYVFHNATTSLTQIKHTFQCIATLPKYELQHHANGRSQSHHSHKNKRQAISVGVCLDKLHT